MITTRLISGIVGLAALLAVSEPAAAQLPGAGQGSSWGAGQLRYGTPMKPLSEPSIQGRSCVQWCVADASPCDPDYYKVADRRCNVNQNGYFPK